VRDTKIAQDHLSEDSSLEKSFDWGEGSNFGAIEKGATEAAPWPFKIEAALVRVQQDIRSDGDNGAGCDGDKDGIFRAFVANPVVPTWRRVQTVSTKVADEDRIVGHTVKAANRVDRAVNDRASMVATEAAIVEPVAAKAIIMEAVTPEPIIVETIAPEPVAAEVAAMIATKTTTAMSTEVTSVITAEVTTTIAAEVPTSVSTEISATIATEVPAVMALEFHILVAEWRWRLGMIAVMLRDRRHRHNGGRKQRCCAEFWKFVEDAHMHAPFHLYGNPTQGTSLVDAGGLF